MVELLGCTGREAILLGLMIGASAFAAIGLLAVWSRSVRARRASESLERELDALRQSENHFRSLVGSASDVILILDADGAIRYQSPSAEPVWGYRSEALRDRSVLDLVHPDDLPRAQTLLQQAKSSPRLSIAAELRVLSADGAWYYSEVVARNLLSDSRVGGIVATCRDIAERKEFEQALVRQAFYDPLTGLPNRALFLDRLAHALAGADDRGGTLAVLFLDLDNFKVVNDSLGHQIGDQLLMAAAGRLRASVRPENTVARLGGDEFTILIEGVEQTAEVTAVADRILERLKAPFGLNGREVLVTSSIGIAISSPGQDEPESLLRDADLAMYRAKSSGKASCAVFERV